MNFEGHGTKFNARANKQRLVINGKRYKVVSVDSETQLRIRRTFLQWCLDNWAWLLAGLGWMLAGAVVGYFLVGCGGAPFELAATNSPDASPDGGIGVDIDALDPPDAGPDAGHDALGVGHDAGKPDAEKPDAGPDAGPDANPPDAEPDVQTVDASPLPDAATGLCCNRPNGQAVCANTPWFCCVGGACTGASANCAAVWPDGGAACRMNDPCGLIGGPATGGVGPC